MSIYLEIRKEINNPEIDFYYFYMAFLFYENNNELHQILEFVMRQKH
jgi:hypothetical protein